MKARTILTILLVISATVGLTQVSFEFQVESTHEQMMAADAHGGCAPTPPEDCLRHCFNQAKDKQPDSQIPLGHGAVQPDAAENLALAVPVLTTEAHPPQIFPPPKINTILKTQLRS